MIVIINKVGSYLYRKVPEVPGSRDSSGSKENFLEPRKGSSPEVPGRFRLRAASTKKNPAGTVLAVVSRGSEGAHGSTLPAEALIPWSRRRRPRTPNPTRQQPFFFSA